MSPESGPRAKSIFDKACKMDLPSERRAFVSAECQGDTSLEQEVFALLRQWENNITITGDATGPGMTKGMPGKGSAGPTMEDQTIGPYHVHTLIGEGGFGQVYVAEQFEPVKRLVALKLLRLGMNSQQVLARFNLERQALAMMDHPNIARVLDGGTAPTGQPYFVMDLVEGKAITAYCDEQQLTTSQRIEVFIDVCKAIEHAHQKAILHRDIKPSNVIVATEQNKPVPKVIDFGVAKALDQRLTDDSIHTGIAQMIGTPMYMSPEQSGSNLADVDTRSDVYSLGILLYELLTGETPLSRDHVQQASQDHVRQLVRDREATRPSTLVRRLDSTRIAVAANRNTAPDQLSRQLDGDLDWIVMKAIEKDRDQRYQSATALADDLTRYLSHEPVFARPPSSVYRLKKFVRKHRVLCASIASVAAILIVATIFSSWQAYRATQAVAAQKQATQNESLQREIAERKVIEAENARSGEERKRRQAESIRDTFIHILRSPHPELDGSSITVFELLEHANQEIDRQFADDPITKAFLLNSIATTLAGLGLNDRAAPWFDRAAKLFATDPQNLEQEIESTIQWVDSVLKTDQANSAFLPARMIAQRAKRELGKDHRVAIKANFVLAESLQVQGRPQAAVKLAEETYQMAKRSLGDQDPDTLEGMNDLALAHLSAGNDEACIKTLNALIEIYQQSKTDNGLTLLNARNNLANVYLQTGNPQNALAIANQCQADAIRMIGRDHPFHQTIQRTRAASMEKMGNQSMAIEALKPVFDEQRNRHGLHHPRSQQMAGQLAKLYIDDGQTPLAAELLQRVLAEVRSRPGSQNVETIKLLNQLGNAYLELNEVNNAVEKLEQANELGDQRLEKIHPLSLVTRHNLAGALRDAGQFERAIDLLLENLAIKSDNMPETDKSFVFTLGDLAETYLSAEQLDNAVKTFQRFLSLSKRGLPAAAYRKLELRIVEKLESHRNSQVVAQFLDQVQRLD